MAGAEAGNAGLPALSFGLGGGLFGDDLTQKLLPLGVGDESAFTLGGVPAEIGGDRQEDRRRNHDAGARLEFSAEWHCRLRRSRPILSRCPSWVNGNASRRL